MLTRSTRASVFVSLSAHQSVQGGARRSKGEINMSKPKPPKLRDVASEYWTLFLECKVKQDKMAELKQIVTQITTNRTRYQTVSGALGTMPWWFVAVIQSLESGLRFDTHLHNGDRLTGRTTHVPAGRPAANPRANPTVAPSKTNPYTWEESADDAMRWHNFNTWSDWSIVGTLYKLESYNGWGYRMYHSTVLSPYLWSYTDYYTKGKYGSDGNWDANLVSDQAGAGAIMRVMVDSGLISPVDYIGDFPTASSMSKFA
jgi:lysozyme family protein